MNTRENQNLVKQNCKDVTCENKSLVEDGEIDAIPIGSLERIGTVSMQDGKDKGTKEGSKWRDDIEQGDVRVDTKSVSDGGEQDEDLDLRDLTPIELASLRGYDLEVALSNSPSNTKKRVKNPVRVLTQSVKRNL